MNDGRRLRCRELFAQGILACACLVSVTGCPTNESATTKDELRSDVSELVEKDKPATIEEPTVDEVPSPHPEEPSREQLISRLQQAENAGRQAEVREILNRLLVTDPQDYEAVFRLATLEAAAGNLDEAIELFADIPSDVPQAGLAALGASADLCVQAERYDDALARYRELLEVDPRINLARRKLGYLHNRLGRRHEAVNYIRQLCLLGDITQDEMHALIVESDAVYDPPGTNPVSNSKVYWPIGETGEARYLFSQKRYQEAADLVEPLVTSENATPDVLAFFGRSAVEAQNERQTEMWMDRVDAEVQSYPEHWAALGAYLVREAQYDSAIRALAEAVRLDPTDMRSIRRLFQALRSVGREQDAKIWIDRYALLNDIIQSNNAIASSDPNRAIDPRLFEKLASDLEKMGRLLEATVWRTIAANKTANKDSLQRLAGEMKRLVSEKLAFPKNDSKWCGMDFPGKLPEWKRTGKPVAKQDGTRTPEGPDEPAPVSFRDISGDVGLEHQYLIAEQPLQKRFAIYQAYGGGVAALDFDLDGESDLYFTQGAADPPEFEATKSDVVYRTIEQGNARRLQDVTAAAGLAGEMDYTFGVTAGDWNQDGFPDIALANLGVNRLLINRGDGTFESRVLDSQSERQRMCTSVAMGDVTGDHLPDLFVLSYLDDPNLARLPDVDQSGEVIQAISPTSVLPSRDRLYSNTGDGNWQSTLIGDEAAACTGLGVILTDLDSTSPGNEVFVGNDVMRNQLWRRDGDQWVDTAAAVGCAYGSLGASTGAMGIAAGDLDRNGSLDLNISNYVDEPASHYLKSNGIYRDLNQRYGLAEQTIPMVGFGCQAIDYSNNGWQDLVVTNGHVEDLQSHGESFQQPMQLFANLGDRFSLINVPDSGFWKTPRLGRGMATLDFNQDGRIDFALTDLLSKSSLLLNETPSTGHWLQLQLVGTSSERDAIGATIELETNDGQWTRWIVSGDGYFAKNSSVAHFGIGKANEIKRLTVRWPNGESQVYDGAEIDRRYLIIEGNEIAFPLDGSN